MSAANLQNPIFTDNDKAREWLEAPRLGDGRVCPHCGRVSYSTPLKGEKLTAPASTSARPIAASNSP